MKKLMFLCILILSSCTSEINNEQKLELAYKLHIQKKNNYNEVLLDNIKLKIEKTRSIDNQNEIKAYDSLSKKYFEYLTTIEKQIQENGSEFFFDNNSYSQTGEDFVKRTKRYKTEIENLSSSSNFIKRVDLVFNTDDIKTKEQIYIRYLDYFFKGYPKVHSEYFISEKKRRLLELQNEFIDYIIVKKYIHHFP